MTHTYNDLLQQVKRLVHENYELRQELEARNYPAGASAVLIMRSPLKVKIGECPVDLGFCDEVYAIAVQIGQPCTIQLERQRLDS